MKKVVILTVLFLCGLLPATVQAANLANAITLTPMAGGYLFEGNEHLGGRPAYGMALGYNLDAHWGIEAAYTYVPESKSSTDPTVGWTVQGARGDILYHFFPDQPLVPYLAAGGGSQFFEAINGRHNIDAVAEYGGGFKLFLRDGVALRGDVRHVIDFNTVSALPQHHYNNLIYMGGLTFQFGEAKR